MAIALTAPQTHKDDLDDRQVAVFPDGLLDGSEALLERELQDASLTQPGEVFRSLLCRGLG